MRIILHDNQTILFRVFLLLHGNKTIHLDIILGIIKMLPKQNTFLIIVLIGL